MVGHQEAGGMQVETGLCRGIVERLRGGPPKQDVVASTTHSRQGNYIKQVLKRIKHNANPRRGVGHTTALPTHSDGHVQNRIRRRQALWHKLGHGPS